jgi:hypothetical protein
VGETFLSRTGDDPAPDALVATPLHRHGISRLPEITGDKTPKRKFKTYPIGYFHIDIAEVQTAEGRLRLFVAIDRTSKFAFVELHQGGGKMIAGRGCALPYPHRANR